MEIMKTDFLNTALEKMRPKHVFISVIISIILVGIPPIIAVSIASDKDAQIETVIKSHAQLYKNQEVIMSSLEQTNWSIMTILSGNNNNLTLSSSKEIIKATLTSAKFRILKDVEGIVKRNHVNDSSRQIVIRAALKVRLDNYYSSDYSSMARLYYNNNQLSNIWDLIDRNVLLSKICCIIFNPDYHHDKELLIEDVTNEINNEFDGYYEMANRQLNKMTQIPK